MPNVESVYRLRLGYSDVKNTGYSLSYNNTDISFAADGTATVTTYQLDANGNKQLDADATRLQRQQRSIRMPTDSTALQILPVLH